MYVSSMSYAEWERKRWRRIKARGKDQFIWREMVWSGLSWLIVMAVVELFQYPAHSLSLRDVLIWLIPVPILLLVGYWGAGVRWKSLEKRYPEEPPA
jgi:cell division protein FtsW (lipid II flippase)